MTHIKHELKFLELARQKYFTVLENGDIYRMRSKRCKSGCFIKLSCRIGDGGYYRFRFTYLRKRYIVTVHRAVYSFFHGEIPEGMLINHKDGNKQNNTLSNLEIVTPKENYLHARYIIKTSKNFGGNHPCAKLRLYDIAKIMYYHNFGIYTARQLSEMFGISLTHVYNICKLKCWRYLFEREDNISALKKFHSRGTGFKKREIQGVS
jgi:hypothetical protein